MGTLEHQGATARMSQITNDGLTRSGIGYFIAVTVGVKGLIDKTCNTAPDVEQIASRLGWTGVW